LKIKRVKWKDHPVLGDLLLDFENASDGKPYGTIIFAGENGVGKSTVLWDLSSFLNLGSFKYFEYIEYIANGKNLKVVPTTDGNTHPNFFDLIDQSGSPTKIRADRNLNRQLVDSNVEDLRHYGCVFSRARSDYKTEKIVSTTASELDKDRYDLDERDNFTSLKQLIVDIVNQDHSDYAAQNQLLGAHPKTWDAFFVDSKLARFQSSFDNFFERLAYDRVVDEGGEKLIKFKKNGKSIPIDSLSTGEKQIVFRGIYLLKNSKALTNAAVMIDEPELSMHPKWQTRILKYYKDLFTPLGGGQTAQLFVATHSDHVLKRALENQSDNVVIVLSETHGVIQAKKIDAPAVLPSITSAETNYLAFDLISNDYHIELYGYLQDKKALRTVKDCDEYIKLNTHGFYNPGIHAKATSHTVGTRTTYYDTLPTAVRNAIHHPSSTNTFTDQDLKTSIELLIELCR